MILSKQDIENCISKGDLVISPFDKDNLGPSDINLRISRKYSRIRSIARELDLRTIKNEEEYIKRGYFMIEETSEYTIQPNEHLLIESLENLEVPTYLAAFIGLRSTFSRLGLNTPPTLVDPGFNGILVFHLIGSSFPIKLHEGMAIFKVIFMNISSDTEGYEGRYQGQRGIILPKRD